MSDVPPSRTEAEFHALAESMPQMVWITRPDGWTTYFNRQWMDYTGLTLEESLGHGWNKPFHADDQGRASDAWNQATATGGIYSIECRLRRADGIYRWWLVRGVPQPDPSGKVLNWFGTCTDIHELKVAEVALRESEQLFRFLNELGEATRALVDAEQIMAVSARMLREHLGASRCAYADVESDSEHFTILRDSTDGCASTAGRYLLSLFGARAVATLKASRTLIVRDVDAELTPEDGADTFNAIGIKAIITCPLVKDGKLRAMMAVHQAAPRNWTEGDVRIVREVVERCWATLERRSAEERVKRVDAQLFQAQKMEALGQFSGGVAHDFNNILTAIAGYAELSRVILKDNPEVREYLGEMLKATNRAAALVRQILMFSRQQTVERQVIALGPVLGESLKLLRATIPATIEFETSVAANAPAVLANANQVHQVLMNLGINAWHAMKDRPGRLQVRLERHEVNAAQAASQPRLRPRTYARVSVSDTGCGIDAAHLTRIFEPFFTTKTPGEGTGLGLSVVHGIMENHDGVVTVHSQPGEGTMFRLYFPASEGEASVPAPDAERAPRGHGERILVVDDEEILVLLGQRILSGLGYVVEVTTRPVDALERVRANPARFALVLTDMTMPGMTGMALATELQRIRPGLPVLLTTGYSASLTTENLRAAGVRQLLDKPFGLQALGIAVRAALLPPVTT